MIPRDHQQACEPAKQDIGASVLNEHDDAQSQVDKLQALQNENDLTHCQGVCSSFVPPEEQGQQESIPRGNEFSQSVADGQAVRLPQNGAEVVFHEHQVELAELRE